MKEAYVSFEIAKLLKEKGFDEPCRSYFISDSDEYRKCTVDITSKNCISGQILRPTHQMACAWLREVHNIDIEIRRSPNIMMYRCIVYKDTLIKYITDGIVETYEDAVEAALKYSLETLIPKLEESNDEKIKHEIKVILANTDLSCFALDYTFADMVSWLEKQGNKPQGKTALEEIHEEKVDNANKVEQKFHEGDWIARDGLNTAFIINIDNDRYEVELIDGNKAFPHIDYIDRIFHFWTIEDAKDGDVLVDVHGNISIYEKCDDFDWMSYCSLGHNGGFQHFKIEHENKKTHPATKEQRDLLFSKMKEAGYEWDAEKKELRKIEVRISKWNPVNEDIKDCIRMCLTDANEQRFEAYGTTFEDCLAWLEKQGKLKWTDEDKSKVEEIVYFLDTAKVHYASTTALDDCIDWIKSIKKRMKDKYESDI